MVGRTMELSRLNRLVASGQCHAAVVAGPAGVGKTYLATACLKQAAESGLATARVAASRSAAGLPLGAFAALLPPAGEARDANRSSFLGRCCDLLVDRAGGGRLVLLVDDAQLLDDTSATLIHQLVHNGAVFILMTVRVGEPVPDAVAAMWKDELAERLDLDGLSSESIEELLARVLNGPVDRGVVSMLDARCQGNALFLRELVYGALASGNLSLLGGVWRLTGPLTPSQRLVELVESRLRGLGDAELSLLELVALGEPLGAAELSTLAAIELAESLEHQRLLASRLDGRRLEIRLDHPMFGEVIRDRMSALRRRLLVRQLADLVEATGARRREDTLRIANWRLDGGGPVRAELMLSAAQQALARWALPLAERLARAALSAGAGFDAGLLLALLCCLQLRVQEAEELLAALMAQASDDRQRALVAMIRIDNLAFGLGRLSEALGVAEEAEGAITDLGARDGVTAKRAMALLLAGRTGDSWDLVEPLLGRAAGSALVYAGHTAGWILTLTGRLSEAVEMCRQAREAHLALTSPPAGFGPDTHQMARCYALAFAGRLEEGEKFATSEYDRAVAAGLTGSQRTIGWPLAHILFTRGRVREAERLARESASLWGRQFPIMERYSLITLVQALATLGRADEARRTLAEIDSLGLPEPCVFTAELLRARAWTEVASGDLAAARAYLEQSMATARANGEVVFEMAACHDLARLGRAAMVAPRLLELADEVEGDLVPVYARHAQALAGNDARRLEEVSVAFEALGADLLAAESAADAAGVWRKNGEDRQATAAQRRSDFLAARCQGAKTPALQAITTRALITRGEREVALLAAAGRPNKEIAEALFLSTATVQNYLHRVYEKLGISGRSELGAALDL
jgi:DNA-binding CsgD family transcriptional regulator